MGPITSFSELRAALRRQAWLILLVLAIGLPIAYWYAKSSPRLYEATAVLGIEGAQGGLAIPGVASPDIGITRRLDEIQQTLLSRDSLAALVHRLNLFPGVGTEANRIWLTRQAITITRLGEVWRPEVQPLGLIVAVRLEDPEQAAALANTVIEAIMEEDARRERARLEETLESVNGMLGFLRAEELRVQGEIGDLESRIAQYRATNLNSLPENLPDQRELLALLEGQLNVLDREISVFLANQSDRRSDEAERVLTEHRSRREVLLAEIASTEASIAAAPEVERELGSLSRQLQNLEVELGAIVTQRTQASMSQSLSDYSHGARFSVLEFALPPEFRISSSPKKIAMVGAAAALAAALGLALTRELLNPVIRTAAQMQRQLNIEPVVVIPHVRNGSTFRRFLGLSALFVGACVLPLAPGAEARARMLSDIQGQAGDEPGTPRWPSLQ